MDINEAKEAFADILIAYQRGEIDLADALAHVREMGGEAQDDDDNEEVPEYEADGDDDGEGDSDALDDAVSAQAEEELDAALDLVAEL